MELPRSIATLVLLSAASATPAFAATASHSSNICNTEEKCCCIDGKYKGKCEEGGQTAGAKCESHQQHSRTTKKTDASHATAKHESHEKQNHHT